MSPLTLSTLLGDLNIADSGVRREIAEMLPSTARSTSSNSEAVPMELIEEVTGGDFTGTVGDLVLDLAIAVTEGHFADQVEIDASAVDLVQPPLDPEESDSFQCARLAFDLSRPDWTVVLSLQFLREAPEPEPETEGVLRILVRPNLDFRSWITEERIRAMLHEWYVQYQIGGVLHSERQLAELHEELTWLERLTVADGFSKS